MPFIHNVQCVDLIMHTGPVALQWLIIGSLSHKNLPECCVFFVFHLHCSEMCSFAGKVFYNWKRCEKSVWLESLDEGWPSDVWGHCPLSTKMSTNSLVKTFPPNSQSSGLKSENTTGSTVDLLQLYLYMRNHTHMNRCWSRTFLDFIDDHSQKRVNAKLWQHCLF